MINPEYIKPGKSVTGNRINWSKVKSLYLGQNITDKELSVKTGISLERIRSYFAISGINAQKDRQILSVAGFERPEDLPRLITQANFLAWSKLFKLLHSIDKQDEQFAVSKILEYSQARPGIEIAIKKSDDNQINLSVKTAQIIDKPLEISGLKNES